MAFAVFRVRHMILFRFPMRSVISLLPLVVLASFAGATDWGAMMPGSEVRTSLWWRDGFPRHVEGAPWHRCVATGRYGFVLDTESLTIPHLGPIAGSLGELPAAELELSIEAGGKTYTARGAEPASRFKGPRIVESGRFFQRADVTGLRFVAEDGSELNGEARFETVAWSDSLGFVLAARPGRLPIVGGEESFGKVGGGYGLAGENLLDVPAAEIEVPAAFTLSLWVFVPTEFRSGKHAPWLVCKNPHEAADGNFGIVLHHDATAEAMLNIGGGAENLFRARSDSRRPLRLDEWNHLAISYDGKTLRLYSNFAFDAETAVNRSRTPRAGGLAFGGRQDRFGDGYRFRGVVDEVRIYDRALDLGQLRFLGHHAGEALPHLEPIASWSFHPDGDAREKRPRENWDGVALSLWLSQEGIAKSRRVVFPNWDGEGNSEGWRSVEFFLDPVDFSEMQMDSSCSVSAFDRESGIPLSTRYEANPGWHLVSLDETTAAPQPDGDQPNRDAVVRARIVLANPSGAPETIRLCFEKTKFPAISGAPITGVSAILRDSEGIPTGIPIQQSKNWHLHPEEKGIYTGQWFRGIAEMTLPARSEQELELTLAHAHWGGLPAASHAQLSLIGWGNNQRWDQSALGCWGESICHDPEQHNALCAITDVRPLMVASKKGGEWNWTNNIGGADLLHLVDAEGRRRFHTRVQADYRRTGPCLTETIYHGRLHDAPMRFRNTFSLDRNDRLVRATYRLRFDVEDAFEFSRFALFQTAADSYASAQVGGFAVGDESRLQKAWGANHGGNAYHGEAHECSGRIPWASLHEASHYAISSQEGALGNRGFVIREWKARLGGVEARPWIAERGVELGGNRKTSLLEIVPPPGLTRLETGDFVETTIEFVIVPQFAADYYGPDETLRAALVAHGDTWRMIADEATGRHFAVAAKVGSHRATYPAIEIAAENGLAEIELSGGRGQVAVLFTGLTSHDGHRLLVDCADFSQAVHGNDFWQTDFDPATKTWSRVYNLPVSPDRKQTIRLEPISQ